MHRIVAVLTGIILLAGLAHAELVPGSPLGVAFGEGSRNLKVVGGRSCIRASQTMAFPMQDCGRCS